MYSSNVGLRLSAARGFNDPKEGIGHRSLSVQLLRTRPAFRAQSGCSIIFIYTYFLALTCTSKSVGLTNQ